MFFSECLLKLLLNGSSPKAQICLELTLAIRDVDEFVSSSEQIWRNVALHHLLSSGSSAVNGCRIRGEICTNQALFTSEKHFYG